MRKSINELNQIPPELPDDRAKEIAPPPDEFNRFAPEEAPTEKKASVISKVMLLLAAAGVVTLGVITPVVRLNPQEEAPAVVAEETATPEPIAEATPTPSVTPALTPTPVPTPVPTPEPTPVPTPVPTPEPPMELKGQLHIVIYSEILDWSSTGMAEYPSKKLRDEPLMDAATFTEYELPPLDEIEQEEGYTAFGYVLLKTPGMLYFDWRYFELEQPYPIGTVALKDKLTRDDLGILDAVTDEVHEVEIHVVWLKDEGNQLLEFYDGDELFGSYYVGFPMYSEQLCYLAPFPVPEHEGKTFAGWCDEDGRLLDAVMMFDFYPVVPPGETLEDRDWRNPIPCRVYACWTDGTGGANGRGWTQAPAPAFSTNPGPAPEPEPKEQIHITVYSGLYDENADNVYHSGVLAEELLDAESFTGYTLPQPPAQDGMRCIGYVLVAGSSADYLAERDTPGTTTHKIGTAALGDALRPEDLAILEPGEDGVYEAEIQAVWITNSSRYHIKFCDGEDPIYDYYVVMPLEKQGLLYLDAFPKPESPEKTFVGWCDAKGNQIDAVAYADFFQKIEDKEPPNDRDWSIPRTCRVYACWSDGSGGVPEAHKYSVRCENCTFSGGGYSNAKSGSVPSGKTITVTGSTSSSESYFRVTYADGSSESRRGTYAGGSSGNYVFTCTITVTKDIKNIYIWGVIN